MTLAQVYLRALTVAYREHRYWQLVADSHGTDTGTGTDLGTGIYVKCEMKMSTCAAVGCKAQRNYLGGIPDLSDAHEEPW